MLPEKHDPSIFGLDKKNYFGFFTNTQIGGTSPKAAVYSLNSNVVSNFEYSSRLSTNENLDHNVFLINYDASAQGINPVKGASGSILSILGLTPAALLSTVDGEATSGGAAVTPLPEVGDDDEVVPSSNTGC